MRSFNTEQPSPSSASRIASRSASSRGTSESRGGQQAQLEAAQQVKEATSQPQSQHHADRRQQEQRLPPFEGDVSEWGRTQLDSFYDETNGLEPEVSELSSGVSPRDMRPRLRPFDMDAATEALAYQSGMFSRAQALRRDGCAPAAMGVPDDLPTRMAYQQLNILAGMAGKVQDAILHNKRIFEQRLLSEDRALQRRALHGWQSVLQQAGAKRARLSRAQGRLRRGVLLRVFFSWKDELHHADRTLEMKRKVAAVTAAGCLRRCFHAWLVLARERWWKTQLSSVELQVGLLEARLRGFEKRPIQVLRKRRLDLLLSAWLVEVLWAQHKRRQLTKARCLCRHHMQLRAWSAWATKVAEKARQRVLVKKITIRCQHHHQQAAWDAWLQVLECKQIKQQQLHAAVQHCQVKTCLKAWRAWHHRAKQNRISRAAANRWKRPCLARAFKLWLKYAHKQTTQGVLLGRVLVRRRQQLVLAAFSCWVEHVEHRKHKAQLGEKEGLQAKMQELENENARLRRDNERFVRLIDSGEWGRGRVEELTAAGELMRAERDALLQLVQALRREYEAVQLDKEAQHDQLRTLKDKMTVKGAARNCLLVKGGSSFNALVRALKQDLIDSGTAAKDPALLYQIDKLSLDRVQVFPDGELNIQAVASGPQRNRNTLQRQPGSPAQTGAHPSRRHPQELDAGTQQSVPAAVAAMAPATVDAAFEPNPRLRIKVRAYGTSIGGSPCDGVSSSGSPTRLGLGASRTGSFHSPKAGALCGSPLRQVGPPGLSAAAAAAGAAAAAAVSAKRTSPVKGGRLHLTPAQAQPLAGPALVSTDSMLQALSHLTPAQIQRLQQQAVEPRLGSTAPATTAGLAGPRHAGLQGCNRSSSQN